MEFIRKDELKEMLHNSIEYWKDKDDCTLITLLGVVDDVNKLPTIDSETVIYPSRPKGKWLSVDWANEYFDCSICGNRRRGTSRYCEDCGTEMREVERVQGGLSERMVIKNDKWLTTDMRGEE